MGASGLKIAVMVAALCTVLALVMMGQPVAAATCSDNCNPLRVPSCLCNQECTSKCNYDDWKCRGSCTTSGTSCKFPCYGVCKVRCDARLRDCNTRCDHS